MQISAVFILISLKTFTIFFLVLITYLSNAAAQSSQDFRQQEFVKGQGEPTVNDSKLQVQVVTSGLEAPTSIDFIAPNDILVLEKDKGTVMRVINGKVSSTPLLDVNVANSVERCMCGIAISKNESRTYVFLYYTEIDGSDGDDRKGKQPGGNKIYRYELVKDKLVNPVLLIDLPAYPGPRHNGGAIMLGPDQNLYIPIGDVDGSFKEYNTESKAQNYNDGVEVDGRAGILTISQNGQPLKGILGDTFPLRLYYAYGIRNSFGIDFDPITGNLWDTENGPGINDEINLVEPGFNSGWQEVQGLSSNSKEFGPSNLVTFNGKGMYSEPELTWRSTVGPTAIKFLNSDKLGIGYQNDMFVGDVHNGKIYHFDLSKDRRTLILPPSLTSRIINNPTSPGIQEITFGSGFGGITDMSVGPDGYLYVVSIGQGKIFRIIPQQNEISFANSLNSTANIKNMTFQKEKSLSHASSENTTEYKKLPKISEPPIKNPFSIK